MSSILIVDDNVHQVSLLGRMVAPLGRATFATSGQAALEQMRAQPPDLVLLDAEMPGLSGFQVCQAMQTEPTLADVPVIFVTSHGEETMELEGLAAGAVDFVTKPVKEALLLARCKTHLRLKALQDQLRHNAQCDALTGLLNRGAFDERLKTECARAARSGSPLSLVLLDVDHFKLYNDHYGHPAGDECLRRVGEVIGKTARRASDLAARVGGEEFVLLLPDTSSEGAVTMAMQLRQDIEGLALPHQRSLTAKVVTASLGVATYGPTAAVSPTDGEHLHELADQALYAAKAQGRNRVNVLVRAEAPPSSTAGEPVCSASAP